MSFSIRGNKYVSPQNIISGAESASNEGGGGRRNFFQRSAPEEEQSIANLGEPTVPYIPDPFAMHGIDIELIDPSNRFVRD
jgi:hypothetical protein